MKMMFFFHAQVIMVLHFFCGGSFLGEKQIMFHEWSIRAFQVFFFLPSLFISFCFIRIPSNEHFFSKIWFFVTSPRRLTLYLLFWLISIFFFCGWLFFFIMRFLTLSLSLSSVCVCALLGCTIKKRVRANRRWKQVKCLVHQDHDQRGCQWQAGGKDHGH